MKKVLCLGHAAWDITMSVPHYPKENKKMRIGATVECGGGSASVASAVLARWGMDTSFLGHIGTDYYGNRIMEEFIRDTINIDYLTRSSHFKTTKSFIIANDGNGTRTIVVSKTKNEPSPVTEIDFEPDFIFSDGEENEATKIMIEKYPNAISMIDAGNIKPGIIETGHLYDYFVCSKDFAEEFCEVELEDAKMEQLEEVYEKLLSKFKNNVIITLEARGCFTKIDGNYVIIPSIEVEEVDSTGAGDIYHGALLYFIANDYPFKRALILANITGALSTTKLGGRISIPKLDEVLEREKTYVQ